MKRGKKSRKSEKVHIPRDLLQVVPPSVIHGHRVPHRKVNGKIVANSGNFFVHFDRRQRILWTDEGTKRQKEGEEKREKGEERREEWTIM